MPRPYHALTMPFIWRPRHSTAVERRPVSCLPAFGFFQLPRGVPRRLLSEAYHPPHNDPYLRLQRVVAAHYKKDDMLNCWASISDISGYYADFHEGHATVGAGQGRGMACVNEWTAWQGNGMGAAWARHAMCESTFRGSTVFLRAHNTEPSQQWRVTSFFVTVVFNNSVCTRWLQTLSVTCLSLIDKSSFAFRSCSKDKVVCGRHDGIRGTDLIQ